MLSQKLSRRKSALMLEDASWFASLLTARKIQNNLEKMQKTLWRNAASIFFITPVMHF